MTAIASTSLMSCDPMVGIDDAELAAAAYLARYGGRTRDAYQHDLLSFGHPPVGRTPDPGSGLEGTP
jgi:hypothetical protein